MNPGMPTSVLHKPLHKLTEEDLSQVTREDCRKYLKEKGMRRPSWNKSQAIQQVICLKSLFEGSEESGAGALRKIVASLPPQGTVNSADSAKEPSTDVQVSASPNDSAPHKWKDHAEIISKEMACRLPDVDNTKILSPRSTDATNLSAGQMTIFYCGRVNVYDGVPADKAQAIMHLAASPVNFPQYGACTGAATLWSSPCDLQPATIQHYPVLTSSQTPQTDIEDHADRKALLQRYFKKRKGR